MPAVVIAIGNPLRGDDGVAHRVAASLAAPRVRMEQQLTPELAADLSCFDTAIFLDADASAPAPAIEPIEPSATSTMSHSMTPGAVVLLARRLYGWTGEAWLCRLPARSFEPGARLSAEAESHAANAATLLRDLLEQSCTNPR